MMQTPTSTDNVVIGRLARTQIPALNEHQIGVQTLQEFCFILRSLE